mmetsp:Transcript_5462/g.18476  ORF Transcript_5462/g.18476 Transcript_5462/m.18476 type:complete len:228 (+) Transcript_5462:818-1501(+)
MKTHDASRSKQMKHSSFLPVPCMLGPTDGGGVCSSPAEARRLMSSRLPISPSASRARRPVLLEGLSPDPVSIRSTPSHMRSGGVEFGLADDDAILPPPLLPLPPATLRPPLPPPPLVLPPPAPAVARAFNPPDPSSSSPTSNSSARFSLDGWGVTSRVKKVAPTLTSALGYTFPLASCSQTLAISSSDMRAAGGGGRRNLASSSSCKLTSACSRRTFCPRLSLSRRP